MEIRINSWDRPLDHLMPCGHLNEPFFLTRHILPARYLFSPQRAIPSRGSREKCPGGKGRQLLCQLLEGTPWIPKHAWKYKRRSLLFVFLNILDSDVQHWFLRPERLELLIPLLDNWDAFGAASQHLHFTTFPCEDCEDNTYLSSTIQPLTSASVCCHFETSWICCGSMPRDVNKLSCRHRKADAARDLRGKINLFWFSGWKQKLEADGS